MLDPAALLTIGPSWYMPVVLVAPTVPVILMLVPPAAIVNSAKYAA